MCRNAYLITRTDFMQQYSTRANFYACLKEIPFLPKAGARATAQDAPAVVSTHGLLARTLIALQSRHQTARHQNLTIQTSWKGFDQQWLDERGTFKGGPLIDPGHSTDYLSGLAEQQRDSNACITEIIVTDRFGLNVGCQAEITTELLGRR